MESDTAARTGEVDETDRLISSQKVDGTAVYNHQGENLKCKSSMVSPNTCQWSKLVKKQQSLFEII